MRTTGLVCVLALSAAWAAAGDWDRAMDRASALDAQNRCEESAAAYRDAFRAAESSRDDLRQAKALNSLGLEYNRIGRLVDAEHSFRGALSALRRASMGESEDYAVVQATLGAFYLEHSPPATARPLLEKSVAALTRPGAHTAPNQVAVVRAYLASALLREGRLDDAELQLAQSSQALQASAASPMEKGTVLNEVAALRFAQHRYIEAARVLEQILSSFAADKEPDYAVLPIQYRLARSYAELGRVDEADALFAACVGMVDRNTSAPHPMSALILGTYAEFLQKNGREREARAMRARLRTARTELARQNGAGMTVDVSAFSRR